MPLTDVPHWTHVPDHFVWEAFDRASRDPAVWRLECAAAQQEALLAETANFYVIPDQFGVVSGHVLVLPKARTTSIAGLDERHDDEIMWLLRHVSRKVSSEYNSQVVVAEHGECGCATAGQAHIHVLPVPASVTTEGLRTAVNRALRRRMAGVERILYRDLEFTALEDLHALKDAEGAQVIGRQLLTDDLPEAGDYPAAARSATGLTRPYVYFAGPGLRFLSMCSLRSQFAREVVALASGLPPGTWDRRINLSRDNMFATFERLSPVLGESAETDHGFRPRAGQRSTARASDVSLIGAAAAATSLMQRSSDVARTRLSL